MRRGQVITDADQGIACGLTSRQKRSEKRVTILRHLCPIFGTLLLCELLHILTEYDD